MSLFGGIRYFLLPDKSKHRTLKEILGFLPENITLYEQAFTHKSITNEAAAFGQQSNERLEFLGDAILGAVVAEYFFNRFPFENEGILTKLRSKLVSRRFLNQLAIDIGLDIFLETSADTKRSKSIFGDAFEALIGAIYLDHGYKRCRKFIVEKIIKDYINIDELIQEEQDFKSKLIEWTQKEKKAYHFELKETTKNLHKYYYATLFINEKVITKGEGPSKKKAEQAAAKAFFKKTDS